MHEHLISVKIKSIIYITIIALYPGLGFYPLIEEICQGVTLSKEHINIPIFSFF